MKHREAAVFTVAAILFVVLTVLGIALNLSIIFMLTWLLQLGLTVFGVTVPFWPLFALLFVFNTIISMVFRANKAGSDGA